MSIPHTSVDDLFTRYDAFLLDAFGVLVDKQGPIAGARELIARLNREQRPFLVLTNSAARLPDTILRDMRALGFDIALENILSSGMLAQDYFAEHQLQNAPTLVLGPEDSHRMITQAGGQPLQPEQADDAEVVVIADQKGFDLLEGMNKALTLVLRRLDADRPVHLLLCNPDIIYPIAVGEYAFTSGGLAAMLEAILRERYPDAEHSFTRLGKPHAPIFEAALRHLGTRNAVMIGDQPATDIRGAQRMGLDSVLIGTGITQLPLAPGAAIPTWYLPDFNH